MKKITAAVVSTALAASLVAGCGANEMDVNNTTETPGETTAPVETTEATVDMTTTAPEETTAPKAEETTAAAEETTVPVAETEPIPEETTTTAAPTTTQSEVYYETDYCPNAMPWG